MRILERKRAVKVRIEVLALLMGLCILAGNWASISHAWTINLAYVDLSHAIIRLGEGAASRFEGWAWMDARSVREHDAATYGLAMLMAHHAGHLPENWLQEWNKGDRRLATDSLRSEMMVSKLTQSLTPVDILVAVDGLDAQTAAHWLIAAAVNQPKEASVFIAAIESEGLVSALLPDDRIRLATVYGNLANRKRSPGGSTEEVMALVNKSLTLDPQSEMAMIVKALMLRKDGQSQAAIALLEQVTKIHPKSWFAWECLAALRLSASDLQGAESAARMSISFFPPISGGWGAYLLAIALLRQGRCAEALPYAQATVRDYPNAPNYLLGLGDVYWCLGDREQAVAVYQHLVAVAPDYAPYVRERTSPTR